MIHLLYSVAFDISLLQDFIICRSCGARRIQSEQRETTLEAVSAAQTISYQSVLRAREYMGNEQGRQPLVS